MVKRLTLIPLLVLATAACQEVMTEPGDGRGASTVPLGTTDGNDVVLLATTRGSQSTSPITLSTLVVLDPETGATLSTIGEVGYAVNGLEQDPTTGKLYASTSGWDPNHHGLIEIDPTSGAGTPIGDPGWGLTGLSTVVNNITVDSEGQMFGWWEAIENQLSQDNLVSIDKGSGVATLVGDSEVSEAFMHGLDFNDSDELYLVHFEGVVYTIDPQTGLATFVGNLGSTAHHGDFHPSSDLYYGISGAPRSEQALVVANLEDLTFEDPLDALDDNIHTLTFYQPALLPSTLEISFDIKPGSCRNPVNVKAKGVLPAAILGGEAFDVTQVDPASVRLEGVAPLRWNLEDVATPYDGPPEGAYDCSEEGPDGWTDLTLKFENQEIIAALGDIEDGDVLVLNVTGNLKEEFGGTAIEGRDVVVILKKGKE